MTTSDLQQTTPYRVVGTSPAHHDFVDKVKGSLHYAADWQLPGMLHGRVVRSPVPSARITGIDVADGKVRGVRTNRGNIAAPVVVNCTAGWSTLVAALAGVRLPIQTFPLQAAVT